MLDAFGTDDILFNLIFVTIAAVAAGLARGFSGFGSALIFVPLVSAVLGPRIAVPLLLVVDGVMTVGLIPSAYRLADRRDVGTMVIGTLVGVPIGIFALTTLDPSTIRWAIVLIVVLMLSLLMSGWRYHGRPSAPLAVTVGSLAGLFAGAAQIGGPPVVAYWLGRGLAAQMMRANIILYFAASTVVSAVGYLASSLITLQILMIAAIIAPLYGIGVWLGSKMFGLAEEQTFRRICYAMIAFAALISLPILDGVLRAS